MYEHFTYALVGKGEGRLARAFRGTPFHVNVYCTVAAFVGGGVMLNRASNIVLFAEAKYFVNFYKLAEPKDKITDEEWNKYDSWDSDSDLPSKSRKLFQGFMFNLKLGYGF